MFVLRLQSTPEHCKLSLAHVYQSRNLCVRILIELVKLLFIVNIYISLLQSYFLICLAFLTRNNYFYDLLLGQSKMPSGPSVIKPVLSSYSKNQFSFRQYIVENVAKKFLKQSRKLISTFINLNSSSKSSSSNH